MLEQAVFLAIPFVLLAGMVWLERLAVRRGWIVERREPTQLELEMERLRRELAKVEAAIAEALMPAIRRLADAMAEFLAAFRAAEKD